jgi:salicylate hydroxylase
LIKKTILERYHFLRWKDGSTIVDLPDFEDCSNSYGSPYYLIHRADLHAALLDAAEKAGVIITTGQKVIAYDFNKPSVIAEHGKTFTADLLVIADGIKSISRPLLSGHNDAPRDTGDVAYRITIPGEQLLKDPALASLITRPANTQWCGPEAHFVAYPIRDGELYNIVICATSHDAELTDQDAWVIESSNEELLHRFGDWEPRVQKLCNMAQGFLKWRLFDLPVLESWVHPSGKACLLGDSAHPMLPYLGQGAAQAAEDAAVLRLCLSSEENLAAALAKYQEIRLPRASTVQSKTREHQHILHIEDGLEQEQRDKLMDAQGEDSPIFWGYHERRKWLFGHDAEVTVLKEKSGL